MQRHKEGFILFPVIVFLLLTSGLVRMLLCLVEEEIFGQQEFLQCRRNLRLGLALTKAVDALEPPLAPGTYELPSLDFYPGYKNVATKLVLTQSTSGQITRRAVELKWDKGCWLLEKLLLRPPGRKSHPVYLSARETGLSEGSKVFPPLAWQEYSKYLLARSPCSKSSLEQGWNGRLYVYNAKPCRFGEGITLAGDGVLCTSNDIYLGQASTFTGKVWLLAGGNIYVEPNVRLAQAFLYAQNKIVLGRGSRIYGIIVAGSEIIREQDSHVKSRPEVLETFVTPGYRYLGGNP